MILRPYQQETVDALWDSLHSELNALCQAPCGAGKTIVMSHLIKRLLAENPKFRVLILADVEVIVRQTQDKLCKVAPELMNHIGIVCASISDTKHIHRAVTIASRQSLINHLNRFEPVQLCIVDEVHAVDIPMEGKEPDQFGQIINTLRQYNPNMRLLGFTATPYRLNQGHVYGDKNAPGCMPYFPELTHKITVEELQGEGHLVPLTGKIAAPDDMEEALSSVGTIGGEYNLGRLDDLMSQDVHINSAVKVWQEHAGSRKKTLAFCVSIKHAELMAEAFVQAGVPALAIHSGLDDMTSYTRMKALNDGTAKIFTSVAKLTKGLDVTDIDTILMARPTKSTALYVQCLGRGARPAEGKTDCLVLDMVGNGHEHGTDLDKPKVRWSRGGKKREKASSKECPECAADLHPACRVCPECGYTYPAKEFGDSEAPDMVDADYGAQPPVEMKVLDMFVDAHYNKEKQKELIRIRLELETGQLYKPFISASLWLCLPDYYSGFAVTKARGLWKEMTSGTEPMPDSVSECLNRKAEILTPDIAVVDISGKWPEVKGIRYSEIPF